MPEERTAATDEAPEAQEPAITLKEAYAVRTPDDNRRLYAKWAATYESEWTVPQNYIYDRQVAEILCEDLAEGPVLDAGCGTGLVGEELRALGVAVVDGIDISAEMLARAGSKTTAQGEPVFRSLAEVDLMGSIDIAERSYVGIVSAGVFTHGHVGPSGIDELLRVAGPGARCVIGVNSSIFESEGFSEHLARLEADGRIRDLEVRLRQVYVDADGSNPDHMTLIAVFAAV